MDGGAAYDVDRVYREIVTVRERGAEAVVVTVVAKEGSGPAAPGAKMLVEAGGRTVGTVGGGALEALATRRAEALLEAQTSELVRYALGEGDAVEGDEPTGMVCGGRASLFFEYLGQPLRVYLYGAGHVGQAVARTLELLPAYVTVIDPRPETWPRYPGRDAPWPATMRRPSMARTFPRAGTTSSPRRGTPRTMRCFGRCSRTAERPATWRW